MKKIFVVLSLIVLFCQYTQADIISEEYYAKKRMQQKQKDRNKAIFETVKSLSPYYLFLLFLWAYSINSLNKNRKNNEHKHD